MPDQEGREAPAPSLRVLVVEDEFIIAMELEAILLAQGWQVLGPAGSVEEALDLLANHPPDVAMLDVNLRGVMVTPVAEALREQNIPFVLASAYHPSRLQGSSVLGNAVNIGKPVSQRRLVQAILRVTKARTSTCIPSQDAVVPWLLLIRRSSWAAAIHFVGNTRHLLAFVSGSSKSGAVLRSEPEDT